CALTACGSGDGFVGAGSAGGPLAPNFDSIQANVFEPLCEFCHAGANAPAGLRLDAANSYAMLVGIASVEQPSLQRVAAGDPNNSYLIQKLEGTAAVGERMPAGLPALPQADINVIRQWIADGAQPSSAAGGPIRVTSLSPAPNATVLALPASITVGFSRDLNAPSVTTATFTLVRAGADGVLGTADDVAVTPASVTVPGANPRSAVMDLTGVASAFDRYRIRLVGTGPAAILDLAGNALDGEPIRLLPSGDGVAGGDYTATFTVAGTLATLTSIQTNVFAQRCSGCHNGVGATLPGAMNLTSASASHAALVGVASLQVSTLNRVTAGNPNDSYLIRKLEGGPNIVGNRMPLGGPFLPQTTIDQIRLWVTNGAAQ
ncbi:MAG TPA: Ig-like domain-containing protein, partial [Gammaproteobacteria bacterium]|nr:Ig-like domain-containing protein [Gammaproteobacteria bacterium]